MILAIDPGTFESGFVLFDGANVVLSGVASNGALLKWVAGDVEWLNGENREGWTLAIEMVASYGMAVGREVFETVWWIGRFTQAWHEPEKVLRVYRKDVKAYLCGSMKANDSNIRQALIDALGAPGTKAKPGATYGVKSHGWAALAVAVTAEAQLAKRYLPTEIERAAQPPAKAQSNEEFFAL